MPSSVPLLLGAATALAIGAAGCGSAPPAGPTGASGAPVTAPAGRVAASPEQSTLPASPQSAPPARKPRPSASSSPGEPDQGRDLVGAPLVLTGTVRVLDGCTVLEVDGRRWALLGASVPSLPAGDRVTVRGRPARVPAGCPADAAVRLRG
ncbi:hypothetical protein [Actinoplanes nipponensis]|nr:hypothetical protein [Actinoplanes nipponensis]